jgi:hypothetical protein
VLLVAKEEVKISPKPSRYEKMLISILGNTLVRLGTSPTSHSCCIQCLSTFSFCPTRVQTKEKNTFLFSSSVSSIRLSHLLQVFHHCAK